MGRAIISLLTLLLTPQSPLGLCVDIPMPDIPWHMPKFAEIDNDLDSGLLDLGMACSIILGSQRTHVNAAGDYLSTPFSNILN